MLRVRGSRRNSYRVRCSRRNSPRVRRTNETATATGLTKESKGVMNFLPWNINGTHTKNSDLVPLLPTYDVHTAALQGTKIPKELTNQAQKQRQ